MKKRVLVACEESQAVTKAFRKLGIEAFSCDLLPSSGGHPEYHFQQDVLEVMDGWFDTNEVTINDNFNLKFDVWNDEQKYEYKDKDGVTGALIRQIGWEWDLMIAHPPCTFLAISGSQWMSHPEDKHLPFDERRPNPKYPNRRNDMVESVEFVKKMYNSNIKRIAIENPIGMLSSLWMKPHQIIQPYMFGDEATKSTCLWLKNLPNLEPTNIVGKGEMVEFISAKGVKKRQPKWYMDILKEAKTPEQRRTLRSKTFQGIADAIAEQWSKELYK